MCTDPVNQNGESMKQNNNHKNKSWLIILLTLLVLLGSGGVYYLYQAGYIGVEKEQMQEVEPEEEPPVIQEPKAPEIVEEPTYDTILPEYEEKYNENQDLVGWINIPKTNIDYPVMQSDDNDYYLHRDYDENYDFDGLPFLDFRNPFQEELYDNSIIYGHNMGRKGTMFTELMRYTNIDFYKKAPIINFDTIYRKSQWKIIAVAEANTDPRYGEVFQYFNFLKAKDQESLDWYLEEIGKRSYYSTDVDVELGDKLLTLQTCTNDQYDTKLIVVARRIRPGEEAQVDVNKVALNPHRVLPR